MNSGGSHVSKSSFNSMPWLMIGGEFDSERHTRRTRFATLPIRGKRVLAQPIRGSKRASIGMPKSIPNPE